MILGFHIAVSNDEEGEVEGIVLGSKQFIEKMYGIDEETHEDLPD